MGGALKETVTHAEDVIATAGGISHNMADYGLQGSLFFSTEVIMYIGAFVFFCFAMKVGPTRSLMESLNMAACAFSGIAYTVMNHGQGIIEIAGRPLCWIRFVDWGVTTPLLVYNLCKLAGCRHSQIIMLCLLSIVTFALLALSSLFSSLSIYALALTTFLPVLLAFCGGLSSRASKAPSDVRRILWQLCSLSGLSWSCYLITVFMAQSTKILCPKWESIIYSIIDVTYKVGFGLLLCTATSVLDKVAIRDEEM